jgi:hypothetical protein
MISERVRTAVAALDQPAPASRLTSAAVHSLAVARRPVEVPALVTAGATAKHDSYFNHRTQRIASELPQEMIR